MNEGQENGPHEEKSAKNKDAQVLAVLYIGAVC